MIKRLIEQIKAWIWVVRMNKNVKRRIKEYDTIYAPWNESDRRKILSDSVGFLCVKKSGNYELIGTCFNVYVSGNVVNYVHMYVVTCKHVVEDFISAGYEIFIRLNSNENKSFGYVSINGWVFHEDESVDLAVAELDQKQIIDVNVRWGGVDFDIHAYTSQINEMLSTGFNPGDKAVIIGLFSNFSGGEENVPMWRKATIALVPNEDTMGVYGLTQQILIESLAYRGFSGSPVWVNLEVAPGEIKHFLIGVVSAFVPEKEFDLETYPKTIEVVTNMGVTPVVPIVKLYEIIHGSHFGSLRDTALGKWVDAHMRTGEGDRGSRVLDIESYKK